MLVVVLTLGSAGDQNSSPVEFQICSIYSNSRAICFVAVGCHRLLVVILEIIVASHVYPNILFPGTDS